ncbi:MAG: CoB--CoM heterodisulfide reductase iron-sulfur subunit A family protein [Deltaproteobacteria bacterium]|nr:CoB--CoM heterodisulfide reductase iron-sulfur subunit A family protein [Deltaproteobacteria bacterium]
MNAKVLIIGGGVTGMHTALVLADLGISSFIVEKKDCLGGRVRFLSRTFPFFTDDGFHNGAEFTQDLETLVKKCNRIDVKLNTQVECVSGQFPCFDVRLKDGSQYQVGGIVVATGFEPFDPSSMGEYGYRRYANVITAPELEWMLNINGPTRGELRRPSDSGPVSRMAIIFCVGSRNRRLGAPFCSRICCSYSTKQALTVMEKSPKTEVCCFYMDVRTYDRGFEEMYSLAQERGVKYIRGRVSGCKEMDDKKIHLRAEHTLIQKMYANEFDLVSLSTGMRPCLEADLLAKTLGIQRSDDGFFSSRAWFRFPHDSTRMGILIAGCATGMKPIRNCMMDGAAAASRMASLFRQQSSVCCDTSNGTNSETVTL